MNNLSHKEIAERAFEIWQRNGCQIGSESRNWHNAIRELENRYMVCWNNGETARFSHREDAMELKNKLENNGYIVKVSQSIYLPFLRKIQS